MASLTVWLVPPAWIEIQVHAQHRGAAAVEFAIVAAPFGAIVLWLGIYHYAFLGVLRRRRR